MTTVTPYRSTAREAWDGTGFAVLCGWTALALVVAAYLLRRRDA
jgi:hypothetical protein